MVGQIPGKLNDIAQQIQDGRDPERETVRNFLQWFGAQRRGDYIVKNIREAMAQLNIRTEPDFEFAYIDSSINFLSGAVAPIRDAVHGSPLILIDDTDPGIAVEPVFVGGAVSDPTYRIGKLAAANNSPVAVNPNSTLCEAVTLMLSHDYSQLPVMQSPKTVKGIISWNSIGARLALGCSPSSVSDCMELHYEISADSSLFAAIPLIVQHQYVLIRDSENSISGIVTTTDLSLQFRQLGEPFLLIGEVENHIRRLIDGKFTVDELAKERDPADEGRQVTKVSDLAFGEYIRLLQKHENWNKLNLAIDRKIFTDQLDKVRLIRNDVMHFDPDGLPDTDVDVLRRFVRFLQTLQEVGVT